MILSPKTVLKTRVKCQPRTAAIASLYPSGSIDRYYLQTMELFSTKKHQNQLTLPKVGKSRKNEWTTLLGLYRSPNHSIKPHFAHITPPVQLSLDMVKSNHIWQRLNFTCFESERAQKAGVLVKKSVTKFLKPHLQRYIDTPI